LLIYTGPETFKVTVHKKASSGNQELEINVLSPSPNPSSGTDVMSDAIMHCNYVCEYDKDITLQLQMTQ
jgi:hypothetical protein